MDPTPSPSTGWAGVYDGGFLWREERVENLRAIQLWVALRFASFVPALAVGIGGTFFSVVATSAKQGVFFPWQMPVNMLATEAWRVQTALGLGLGLGAVMLIGAVVHLSRREVL